MTYSIKEGSVRNYILATFLKNYKKKTPYCFWPNEKYYNKFEPDCKAILDWRTIIVVITSENEGTNIYGGPFTLKRENRVHGWAVGSLVPNKPLIYSIYAVSYTHLTLPTICSV